jgi:hypothetical protein
MSVRRAVYSLLSGIEADVFPIYAPQETTDPYVVYSMRREPILTQDFSGPEDIDLTIEIYASTFDLAVSLADTIFAGLDNASGSYDDKTLLLSRWVSESDNVYIGDLEKVNITQEYNLKFE